jgi:MFS family permease
VTARVRRPLPTPLWGILTLPFGLTVGFATVAVPFVLRRRDVDMTLIGTVTQVAALPHVLKLFWAPVLDSGPRRRSWYFAMIALTAASLALTALIPPSTTEHLGPVSLLWVYTGALFLAQAAVGTSASAVLALMALTVPDAKKGTASGWQTAGNLVGTATGGALVAWMIDHLSPSRTAIVLAALCVACSMPAVLIDETPPERHSAARLVVNLLREIWTTLKSRDGWTGLVICLSPVGAGALTNLFSALARDYATADASAENLVVFVNGIFGGLLNAAGSLLGGILADRMNRRVAYVLFGAITALSAVGMMIASASPLAFTVGCLAYTFANGLCYAAFYAFLLELVGTGKKGVTTQLALFVGASNLAISYVTWLDGASYDWAKKVWAGRPWAGREGMLGMDALSTFVGVAILAAMMVLVRKRAGAREAPACRSASGPPIASDAPSRGE